MVTVSLTTDWGSSGYYSGIFKAKLVKSLPGVQLVEISNEITPFEPREAMLTLRNCFKYFPTHSIHVVSVAYNKDIQGSQEYICFQYNYQFFIGQNNGFWEILLDELPKPVFKIKIKQGNLGAFPEVDAIVETINKIALGNGLDKIGEAVPCHSNQRLSIPFYDNNIAKIHFIYYDSYGNGVTDLTKQQFEEWGQNRPFILCLGTPHDSVDTISTSYEDYDESNSIIALFNVAGFLELSLPFSSFKQYYIQRQDQTATLIFFNSEEEKTKYTMKYNL